MTAMRYVVKLLFLADVVIGHYDMIVFGRETRPLRQIPVQKKLLTPLSTLHT